MKETYKTYLTPEIMKEIMKMKSAEEIVKYAAEKNITISVSEADNLLKKFAAVNNDPMIPLSDEELANVAGGGQQCVPSSRRPKKPKPLP